ncbi:Gustatory receptor 81a [Halyomorpha halys]|nr:Gustatory receptor 81a [Halyomorpha halys]
MFNECFIEKFIFRLCTVSKWFGLFPLTINNGGFFQWSLPISIFSFMIIVPEVVVIIIIYDALITKDSWVSILSTFCCVAVHHFYPIISISESVMKLEQLNLCIAKLRQVWEVVFPTQTPVFACSKTYLIANVVLLSATLIIYPCFLFPYYRWSNYIMTAMVSAHVLTLIIVVDRFSGIISVVTSVFRSCNEELESLPSFVARVMIRNLERLAWAHDQLCDCATLISSMFCFQIIVIINLCLFSDVILGYNLINTFINGACNFSQYLFHFVFILAYNNMVWRIVDSCERCKIEAKKFNTLLYQLMIDDKTNEISENKKLRLHISMKREVVFSACGFFNLDYTLIHSMVAAATTYLVILIQFGQPMNNEVPPEHLNATLTTSSEVSNFFTTPSWIYTTI